MKINKTLRAGQPGTQSYLKKYGDALICVRYRESSDTAKRLITVELIEEVHQKN